MSAPFKLPSTLALSLLSGLSLSACLSPLELAPHEGGRAHPEGVEVKMDFLHKPLPEIPLPNDLATRYDPTSPTLRRVNASMVAPTALEVGVRAKIDELDGWGVLQPISVPFTGLIDLKSLLKGHRDVDGRFDNDVVFLVDLTPGLSREQALIRLDIGEGSYPVILEDRAGYWEHDRASELLSITFEERREDLDGDGELGLGEDLNGNGALDEGEDLNGDGLLTPPEDLDADGVLDVPNYLPCAVLPEQACDEQGLLASPPWDNLAARADALMSFYERESDTLLLRPFRPLRERTTYAVVITKRLLDLNGDPVGSPFDAPYHLSQHEQLSQVGRLLPEGLSQRDVAFAFTFTTQTLSSDWVAVREGLYGEGVQAHIGRRFPAKLKRLSYLRDVPSEAEGDEAVPYLMPTESWLSAFRLIASSLLGLSPSSQAFKAQLGAQEAIDYHVMTSFSSPQLFSREPTSPSTLSCEARCERDLASCDPELLALSLDVLSGEVVSGEAVSGDELSQARCVASCEALPERSKRCLERVDTCEGLLACQPAKREVSLEGAPNDGPNDEPSLDLLRPCEAGEVCAPDQDDPVLWQPFNEQAWPVDLSLKPAEAYPEEVPTWLMMPQPEAVEAYYEAREAEQRARGETPPPRGMTPVVLLGHGYGSTRFEALSFAGYFARLGIATLAIDCPSHGIGLSPDEQALALSLTERFGIRPFFKAATKGRARDQNFDGRVDSGADFWTSYVFHTRDVVRQCVLDSMQLIRVLRSFDGERRWSFDVNGDGEPELAGDFNGDGVVDIGLTSPLSAVGGSLGGITSTLLASLEPEIEVAVPISGGGGLSDVGVRSLQGGVREAVILRVMGPLWLGEPQTDEAGEVSTRLYTLVPELNDDGRRDLGVLPALKQHDTVIVENLTNGERGCAYVQESGAFRVGVESDEGDLVRLIVYAGPQLNADGACGLREGAPEPLATLERFEREVRFLGKTYPKGAPLMSLAEGFGEARATPGLRRFLGLGQLVLDGGDPATYARHASLEPLRYPTLNQQTGAHVLVVTTMGDMNVPASTGATVGRAMGLIDDQRTLPTQEGKTAHQVLLESYTLEAVHSLGRHRDESGAPVHLDIEGFSGGDDYWTARGVPRLRNPLRAGLDQLDPLGGYSGAIFPYATPEGRHGFNFPGDDGDLYIKRCVEQCEGERAEGEMGEGEMSEEGAPSCGEQCAEAHTGRFDVGYYFFNLFGHYLRSGGMVWAPRPCYATARCED